MSLIDSNLSVASKPAVTCNEAGKVLAVRAAAAAPASLAADDVFLMAKLPAGYVITGGYLAATDLDTHATTPTITLTVGLMDLSDTTLDANTDLLTVSTVGQDGSMAAFTKGLTQGPFAVDKFVAVKVVAAAATKAAGTVYCQVEYAQP
uniref:Uncharacterized protein n=1 Tax=Desulfovibrio sp. U5L TaxID=596152 RepID=I2Q028_9BACT